MVSSGIMVYEDVSFLLQEIIEMLIKRIITKFLIIFLVKVWRLTIYNFIEFSSMIINIQWIKKNEKVRKR